MKEFFTFWKGIVLKLITSKDASYNRDGAVFQDTDRKVKIVLDGAEREVITNDQTQTLENKSIDAASNPITNIRHGVESDDPITAVHGVGAGDIVGTDKVQTITNKVLDIDNNTLSNVETDNLKAGVLNTDLSLAATDTQIPSALASKTAIESVAGDLGTHEADTSTHGVTEIVGASEAQTLTTKVISADDNTISELEVDNLKAGVLDTDLTAVSATDDTIPSAKATKDYIDTNDTAANTSYDNVASGLSATNVKDAIDEVDSNIEAHEAATTVHGIVGDVVGDQDVQQLTNKDFDGGTASDTSRITLPKNTTTGLDLLTDKEGTIAFDTDKESIVVNDGVNWNEVKGSGGGINYVTNPDAENGLADVSISGTIPLSLETVDPLFDSQSFKISGDGVTDYSTDKVLIDLKTMDNAMAYSMASGSFWCRNQELDSGDIIVKIYDIDNAQYISLTEGEEVGASLVGSFTHSFSFQTTDSLNYRLELEVVDGSNAFEFVWDNIIVGPAKPAVIGAPDVYLGELATTGTWVANTTYTGKYWRRGDKLVGEITVDLSGVPTSTSLSIDIPYTIDTSKVDTTANASAYGEGQAYNTGINSYPARAISDGSTDGFRIVHLANTPTVNSGISATAPFTFGSGDTVVVNIEVPIAGWSSGVTMSETVSNREISFNAYLSSTQNITTAGSQVKVELDSITTDTVNAFDTTNNKYVIPENGTYIFTYGIYSSNSSDAYIAVGLRYANTTNRFDAYSNDVSVLGYSSNTTPPLYFEKGVEIEMYVQTPNDTNWDLIHTELWTKFSGYKVNVGTQTVAASEKVLAHYETNSAQNIPKLVTTPLNYHVKVTDTHNAVTTGASWRFTAPRAGIYTLTLMASLGGNALANTSAYYLQFTVYNKNGTVKSDNNPAFYQEGRDVGTPWSLVSFNGSMTIHLEEGEYIIPSMYHVNSIDVQLWGQLYLNVITIVSD